jgi:uncharacterized protein (DUF1330 family)
MHKPNFIFTALAVFALSFVFLPNLSAQTKTGAKPGKSSHAKMADSSPAAKEKTPNGKMIEFKQDKVYEFAALWVKPSKEKQLAEYFNQAFPIAMQHGVRPVINFTPESSYAGDFKPVMFFVNEWPSLEAFNQFINDPQEKKLIPQRDEALERLAVTHAQVQQPATVTLKNGGLVEFAAMWIKPGKQEQLNRYYGQAFPIAVKYGVRRLAGFVPVNVYRGDLNPQVIGLNQWPSPEAFQRFIKDADLQKLLPARDEVLSRLVVNHNRVSFEEGAH